MDSPVNASLVAKKNAQTAGEATSQVDEAEEFHPMTAQEAQAWRARHPTLSVWWVVGVQLALAVVVSLLSGWIWGRASLAFSLMYGAVAVVLPAALFARGLTSRLALWRFVALPLCCA